MSACPQIAVRGGSKLDAGAPGSVISDWSPVRDIPILRISNPSSTFDRVLDRNINPAPKLAQSTSVTMASTAEWLKITFAGAGSGVYPTYELSAAKNASLALMESASYAALTAPRPQFKPEIAGAFKAPNQSVQPPRVSGASVILTHMRNAMDDCLRKLGRTSMPQKFLAESWEHLKYLEEVSTGGNPPPVAREVAALARDAWTDILAASGFQIPVPSACTGPDGQIFYSWDNGRHHLELEITPGVPAFFFYRDRLTKQTWGEDYRVGDSLSEATREKIKLIVDTS
jgi:hypothetical protein